MRNFFLGIFYLLMGIRHLSTKGLKRYIIVPLMLNLIMFTGLFYFIFYHVLPYIYHYLDLLPSWLSFFSHIFLIALMISFFLMFLSLFTIVFNLVAAPLNGLLAEKTQNLFYGSAIPSVPFYQLVLRSVKRQGAFLGYFIPRFLGLSILFFIPFLQPIYPFLWFFFNAWVLSMQYQDFPMDNNLISFQDMKVKVARNKSLSFGFGFSINVASVIPFLNILTMPAAVIASTILFCEHNKHILEPHSRLDQRAPLKE